MESRIGTEVEYEVKTSSQIPSLPIAIGKRGLKKNFDSHPVALGSGWMEIREVK